MAAVHTLFFFCDDCQILCRHKKNRLVDHDPHVTWQSTLSTMWPSQAKCGPAKITLCSTQSEPPHLDVAMHNHTPFALCWEDTRDEVHITSALCSCVPFDMTYGMQR
jgi:hypothetical protein